MKKQKPILISGIASDTKFDLEKDRMSLACLRSMSKQINRGGVPIYLNHGGHGGKAKQYGIWTKATVRNNRLYVKGEINPRKFGSLQREILQRVAVGLSISAMPKDLHYQKRGFVSRRVYDDTVVHEISIATGKINPRCIVHGLRLRG